MADKITCRLQTPADNNGKRKDVHFITSTDEVITPNGSTLTEVLPSSGVTISTTKPSKAGLWFKPNTNN